MHFGSVTKFQGLEFTSVVRSEANIAAIVGRNGAGKTRLLKAIAGGEIEFFVHDTVVPKGAIRFLDVLQPGLMLGFDPIQHRELVRQAVAQYNRYKGKFDNDPQRSVSSIEGQSGSRVPRVNIAELAQVVSRASQVLARDVNQLDDADIVDFFTNAGFMAMGSVNVTATVRTYLDRLEQNEFNEFRNNKYGEGRLYFSPEEFAARFGPPPWEVLNKLLMEIFDGRYYFEAPISSIAGYDGRLYREDGLVVDPSWLSSGEKTLMWLCLSMYGTSTGRVATPPKLLLLDEPDGSLHPQMVQKLHMVLKGIAERFGCGILFTTHSPTTIALFNTGPIWHVSEDNLMQIEKDAAIRELLVGLDEVSIHYTKCKHVYVESHKDEDIYRELFGYLRRWNEGISLHIALSFIPAAPKLAPQNIREILKAQLSDLNHDQTESLIQALNGQGSCAQVIGAVESLNAQDGVPVLGIIDWDSKNKPQSHVYVLGEELFYSIENAVMNPLTLGVYLIFNFRSKIELSDYGLDDGFDLMSLYTNTNHWQSIADGVMRRALKVTDINNELECVFLRGGRVHFDRRYMHMNGHELETRLREAEVYPFLSVFKKRPTLIMDVVERGIQTSNGRTMPQAFAELFSAIQTAN